MLSRVSLPLLGKAIERSLCRRTFAEMAAQPNTSPPSSTELKFTFASPIKAIYANAMVKQVDVPGMSCSMGILPIHVPTLAVLKPGIVKVYELDGNVSKFFVSSGTLSMNIDGSCQVLAEELCNVDALDEQAIKTLMDNSQKKASDLGSNDVEKAEAGISIDVAEAALRAIAEK
uniref:F-ATPase delta subunit n=1 Tax=Globodera pallida TaxID=36090 RepID=A0A183CIK2_GLOPA